MPPGLFEQGEDYAARLEEKLFELYGMKSTAAGRRTAALVAHNLLVDNPGLHAVYGNLQSDDDTPYATTRTPLVATTSVCSAISESSGSLLCTRIMSSTLM